MSNATRSQGRPEVDGISLYFLHYKGLLDTDKEVEAFGVYNFEKIIGSTTEVK